MNDKLGQFSNVCKCYLVCVSFDCEVDFKN